ncbi:MAG: hypothetical protein AAF497_20840, partial [Planctomycetota bacterium]
PKFVFSGESGACRVGQAHDSMVGLGSIISGGTVKNSIVGRNVRVECHAKVDSSILFDNVRVGERCQVNRAILGSGVVLPPDTHVGIDISKDRQRGFKISDRGIVVVTKGCLPDDRAKSYTNDTVHNNALPNFLHAPNRELASEVQQGRA